MSMALSNDSLKKANVHDKIPTKGLTNEKKTKNKPDKSKSY